MSSSLQTHRHDAFPPMRSLKAEILGYITLAYLFSWALLIGAIKLDLSEEYLNIGIAGPALAAIFLSRNGQRRICSSLAKKYLWFLVWLILGWIVLSLHYSWWGETSLRFHLRFPLLIPALVPAWILTRIFSSDLGVHQLLQHLLHRIDLWSLYALLFFPVMLGLPSLIAHAFKAPLITPSLGTSAFAAIANALMFFLFNLLFVGVAEEPGWRGFLLDRLQAGYSPLISSLLVWLPWACWHAPLDYYRPVRFTVVEEILLRVAFLIPLTIVITWFYNRSGRSIQATVIFHTAMNTYPYVVPYYQLSWLVVFIFAGYAVISEGMWRKSARYPHSSQRTA